MKNTERLMILGLGAAIAGVIATAGPADAQTREARGTITGVTEKTLSMKAGAEELTVFVDGDTHLEVRRLERDVQRAQPGRPSARVNDFFRPGQVVLVRYQEEKGRNHATDITRVASASNVSSDPVKISDGTVKNVSASQLTIEEGGRDLTFGISRDTGVIVRGATKATKAAGGTTSITTFVHTGDAVSIRYHDTGAKMMASEVRVKAIKR